MSGTSFHVRPATLDDVALLADLGARTFRDAFEADNRPEDMQQYLGQAFDPAVIAEEFRASGSTFLLGYDEAFDSERPVGYTRLLAGSAPECVSGPKPVQLVRIYVEQKATGGGHGSSLMRATLDEARGQSFETIWLGAWELNERAVRFYERWGFRVVGSKEFVFGEDLQRDLVMVRPVWPANLSANRTY